MSTIYVLGATGFTGQLICRELQKAGLSFWAVGRAEARLEALQQVFGKRFAATLTTRTMSDFAHLAPELRDGDILINAVGPYLQLGPTFLQPLLRRRVQYLDLTGEQAFVQWMMREHKIGCWPSGVVQACAFESFFADLMAERLLREQGACLRVETAYLTLPPRPSPGTKATMRQSQEAATWRLKRGELESATERTGRLIQVEGWPEVEALWPVPFPEVLFLARRARAQWAESYFMGTRAHVDTMRAVHDSRSSVKVADGALPPPARGIFSDPFDDRWAEVRYAILAAVYESPTSIRGHGLVLSGRDPYFATAVVAAECAQALLKRTEPISGYFTPAEAFSDEIFERIVRAAGAELRVQRVESSL